ncbi:MAG TPA: carbohydrate binding domain-containing protein [Bryobacteraceae bacterium]|nr:carbohydrate binding domain-containing protein [Bryobacteraceae bacterium]
MRPVFLLLMAAAGYAQTSAITNLTPGSNLLAPGSTSVALSFNTTQPALCRYSVGSAAAFAAMQPFDSGPASTTHKGTVRDLSASPAVVNSVYLRCDSDANSVTSLQYRAAASPSGALPRIGSIWWGSYIAGTKSTQASKIQLYLCPAFSIQQAQAARAANPNVLMLPNVNSMETASPDAPPNVPESYYLHDTSGKRIPNWPTPGDYMLNMTNPAVADFLANYAYHVLLQSGLVYDGVFFDNFSTSISWKKTDYAGNPVQIDANNDGQPDDPAWLDAAWSAGVYRLIASFRKLVPYGVVTGHLGNRPPETAALAAFSGESMNGDPVKVREGVESFGTMWQTWNAWFTQGQLPSVALLQSSPPLQVAYGYGFAALNTTTPALQAFAQSFYPNMRFGLATALMQDGFSVYDFGDTSTPVNWWYDEYDFNLGYPLGGAKRIGAQGPAAPNLIANPGFESPSIAPWTTILGGGGKATFAIDDVIAAAGNSSVRMTVTTAASNPWLVSIEQDNLPIVKGATYQIQFWARSDSERTLAVNLQGGAPNYPYYGLYTTAVLGPSWNFYTATVTTSVTANDARLEFWVGDATGSVWLDGVQMSAIQNVDLFRRDTTNGVVLLNGTASPQTVTLEPGLKRFSGTQAPKYQYIVDDSGAGFQTTGNWSALTMDSGFAHPTLDGPGNQLANGPYYHAWQAGVHEMDDASGTATWDLHIPADGSYTLQVWLPAAPKAGTWTKNAVYEILSGGQAIATATLDQSSATAGDSWHNVGTWNLTVAGTPSLRLHNAGSGPVIADAAYVTSAALYNDGSAVSELTLNPFDAILLQRVQPVPVPSSRVTAVAAAADGGASISSGSFVSIYGEGFTDTTRTWAVSDFIGSSLPTALDGVSVTINGKAAAVSFISPTQINVIAPDDSAAGAADVQVTTPRGKSYPGSTNRLNASPAFFRFTDSGIICAAAVHADGTLVAQTAPASRPAVAGETISIYGTGFGATDPATPANMLFTQANPLAKPVTVTIGGVDATVVWAGMTAPGLVQVNVQIPDGLAPGNQPLMANAAGFQTLPGVFVPIGK